MTEQGEANDLDRWGAALQGAILESEQALLMGLPHPSAQPVVTGVDNANL